MSVRPRKPNKDFTAIAEQLAGDLAAKLEASGFPVTMDVYMHVGPLITTAFSHLVGERGAAAAAARRGRRDAWVAEHGLLTWQEAQERLGLSSQELYVAVELNLVRYVEVRTEAVGYAFVHDRVHDVHELTPADRQVIAEHVYLTRVKAAERLGISPVKFDTLRKRAGLQHAKTERGESGWPLYLYRQSDVDRLRGKQ